jgi:phage gp29-like protein
MKRPNITRGEIIPTRPLSYWNGRAPRDLTPGGLTAILNSLDAGDVTEAMAFFDEMEEKDLHLGAVMQTRSLAAVARERDVLPAAGGAAIDAKIADFVREVFEALPRKNATLMALMSAVSHGFSVAEMIWDAAGGAAVVKEIIPRPQKYFTFVDFNDPLRILDFPKYRDPNDPAGVFLPREKFVFHHNGRGPGEFLRSGLYRGVAWYYLFTNYTIKDWLSFIDISGVPLRLGKYGPTADERAREVLKDAVVNLGSDAAAVISDDTTVEFIQSAISGSHTLFMDTVEYFNRLKSKRVLGQTLTTESGQSGGGSHALGKVHEQVRQDIVAFDCRALDETLSQDFVRPLVDYNFGPQSRYPRIVTRLARPGETEEKLAQLKAVLDMGAKAPARLITEITGMPILGDPEAPLVPAGGK